MSATITSLRQKFQFGSRATQRVVEGWLSRQCEAEFIKARDAIARLRIAHSFQDVQRRSASRGLVQSRDKIGRGGVRST